VGGERLGTRLGFGFTSDWSRKWREFFNQSHSIVKENQNMSIFDTRLKTALAVVLLSFSLERPLCQYFLRLSFASLVKSRLSLLNKILEKVVS